ncbi:thiol:disulfide interchange protein [Shewanella hanedai]|uniref:Thiol:disulfide interchange protein n=1 Tax=Shewanella hanedai TaxID=25 RepID=A0A553JK44_SHEHA|nr:thiol:disulfide interchange protein DsbA/DsbL [Shewanella hanedai]TRY12832.1 thiol:disulfide interchange protein DsbA/DsbL [Shewanella hanedai]GGI92711.1 thiol:disulfide interchange protein [Shewanella hanedai]
MKTITKPLMAILFLCAANLISMGVVAKPYVEGVDYTLVTGIPESNLPVVREFFSYNCPHCYRQDPLFTETEELLKGKVEFARTPVGAGRASWILSQEAYYLAKKFKLSPQLHGNIFKRIHEKGQAFTRKDQLTDYFVKQGVKRADVETAINSVDASVAISHYDSQAQLAGIRGVPSLLVNGKYLISSKHRSAEELVELVTYLSVLENKQ